MEQLSLAAWNTNENIYNHFAGYGTFFRITFSGAFYKPVGPRSGWGLPLNRFIALYCSLRQLKTSLRFRCDFMKRAFRLSALLMIGLSLSR